MGKDLFFQFLILPYWTLLASQPSSVIRIEINAKIWLADGGHVCWFVQIMLAHVSKIMYCILIFNFMDWIVMEL